MFNKEKMINAYCPKCNARVDGKYPMICMCPECGWSGALAHCKIEGEVPEKLETISGGTVGIGKGMLKKCRPKRKDRIVWMLKSEERRTGGIHYIFAVSTIFRTNPLGNGWELPVKVGG